MSTKNLLVELFVEELPPKALEKLGEAFGRDLYASISEQWLIDQPASINQNLDEPDAPPYDIFASPRRLAVLIRNVKTQAPKMNRSIKLMPVNVGLDANGSPTPALLNRLKKEGLNETEIKNLIHKPEGNTEFLYREFTEIGVMLRIGLNEALAEAIAKLPIPKVMTYQLADGWTNVNFVRPAHGLVALHGSDVVAVTALGLKAGNTTHGHRFEAKVKTITLKDADSYSEQLKTEGAVIASFDERRAEIVHQLNAAAAKEHLKPIEDDALLDEVTGLVERPNVLLGQFEEIYLEVPQECLILTMKANQKYFPLLDANGKLTNKFLIVSNISPADSSAVIGGNERVVRPRLADAKFFFDQDRKKKLHERLGGLEKVVYHNKLGNQAERNQRVTKIATDIARKIGDETLTNKVMLAASLSKADLLTDMVGEFPELQGIMGRYYAQHEGMDDDITYAIEDHYKPRFAGDNLPRNEVGIVVALADKLETLVGLFSIGEKPTGDKDPFGLRRQALGILRILIERNLQLPLSELIGYAEKSLRGLNSENYKLLVEFLFDRLAGLLRDQGYSAQEIEAVLSQRPQLIAQIPNYLTAVQAFAKLPEAPALAAANKRVGNILKKVEGNIQPAVNVGKLVEPAEVALNDALAKVKPVADKAFENGDYTASLQALAALKAPIDAFFDGVMVNAEDQDLRANRLALLSQLHAAMNRVADLSKLAS